ncbi:MAG TPA: MarR family transcriptional regulator [Solirubrobacterales bacterium]|nr:MarR family transcriptional regulator [Solirubrobacterales bacterium]
MAPDATETAMALTREMRALRGRLREESQPPSDELTLPQALALGSIREGGPITNAALAQIEHVRHQTMNQTVAVLSDRGYVKRRPDPDDARRVLIEITAAGDQVLEQIMTARYGWLSAAIEETLTPAERDILAISAELMRRLAGADVPSDH